MSARRGDLLVPRAFIERACKLRGWKFRDLAAGRCPVSLDRLQLYLIRLDPVLWAERMLIEREAAGLRSWRLWPYQAEALRCRGLLVFSCAAEVGKTRDLVARHMWRAWVYGRDQLVGAALDGHLDSIWDEVMYQIDGVPAIRAAVKTVKMKPYRKVLLRNGARVDYRPAGKDGKAFRGVHAVDGCMDEAAIVDREGVWSEFWRAIKVGGEINLYSVPNGDRTTPWARLRDAALPLEDAAELEPDLVDPLSFPMLGTPDASRRLRTLATRWTRVWWAKDLMPATHWDAERDEAEALKHGGRDSSGYQRNVRGLDGDLGGSVWSYRLLAQAARPMPDYRHLELVISEEGVTLGVTELDPEYSIEVTAQQRRVAASRVATSDTRSVLRTRTVEVLDLEDPAEWRGILAPWLAAPEGRTVMGVDVGWTIDPTEVVLLEVGGDRGGALFRWVLRITLRGQLREDARVQRAIINGIDMELAPALGWGLDVTGDGIALESELRSQSPRQLRMRHRMTGYVMGQTRQAVDVATGEPLTDDRGRERLMTHQELATDLLTRDLAAERLEMPTDTHLLRVWASMTSTSTKLGRRSYHTPGDQDHTIEAVRVARLRAYELLREPAAPPPMRHRKVPGARRKSADVLRKM